ncbi:MAG: glycosyltransferase [Candidatus Dormibacteraeota bacterium]|nr:glycosyltransferase [Candidatus Dormibacteraeota bacterium]
MSLSISVVIPTHQRPESLLRVLDALSHQEDVDLRRVELVVICDGINDPGFDAVQRGWYPMRLQLAQQEQQGPAAARNHGIALSTGQLVVFLDDDVVPGPRLLGVHARAHEDDETLVAIGPLLPPPGHGTPWVQWEGRTVAEQYAAMARGDWEVSPRQFYTGNASVRRIHLVKAFGFDVTFPRGEDVELAFRLRDRGLHFAFLPDATAEHLAQRSYASWIAAAEDYGRFEVRMGRDRGHQDLLDAVTREFHHMHPLSRLLARVAIRNPAIAQAAASVARPTSLLAQRAGAAGLSRYALSAAFNAVRLTGFAAEIGDARPALALLNRVERWPADASVTPAPAEPQAPHGGPA